jgi:hypothetical protein
MAKGQHPEYVRIYEEGNRKIKANTTILLQNDRRDKSVCEFIVTATNEGTYVGGSSEFSLFFFYVHVTVHRDKFPYSKTN